VTRGGQPIYDHAKVLVMDDRLLRVGSSNLNNRSMGFDSECDVAVEADPSVPGHDKIRSAILSVRQLLVGEHLDVSPAEFDRVMNRSGSFLRTIESLHGQGKSLRRFEPDIVAGEASPLAENDLMDPDRVPQPLIRRLQRFVLSGRR
jgi:phosphatidylserine/phosphatidylglycerophosphate/cardiolipin synthase-like enzyme